MKLFFKKISDPKRNILFLLVMLLFTCGSTSYEPQSEEIVFRVEGKKKCVFGENLLRNPGFETKGYWNSYREGYEIDAGNKHSGDQSMKIVPTDVGKLYGAFQVVSIDFGVEDWEKKIVIGGWSKNEGGVAGTLYADVYSKDRSETWY